MEGRKDLTNALSGLLNGQMPDYPKGALNSSRQSGENRVTWQPNSTVRVASVVVPYNNGFVMAGRNMREVEQRELNAEQLAGAAWLLTLIATFAAVAFGEIFLSEKFYLYLYGRETQESYDLQCLWGRRHNRQSCWRA